MSFVFLLQADGKPKKNAVLLTAFAALHKGLFTVPNKPDEWNARQCLGFLLHAYQLQERLKHGEDAVDASRRKKSVVDDVSQCCIVTGAAGTGKTALLAAQDMLTEVVFDSDTCVFRSAPTRTAARLNRGDTVHAAWSLPWSSCLGTHGRLTEKPLQRLRQRLRGKEEATIDEISMLPPDKFYQIICRAAQGMNQHALFMGGLKLRLSGVFLKLPPVRSSSFVVPKETSSVPSTSAPVKRRSPPVKQACEESKQDSDEDEDAAEERRLGVQKFQLIKDVVCLNRVVRAPNALGALCTFVRHCKITDAVWTLLQSLVLRENDDRLGSAVWQKAL